MNTQMNVRIDGDLKSRGDAVFASMGFTPTEVVRTVWSYAVEHGDAPEIVAQALSSPSDTAKSLDSQYRVLMAERAHSLISDFRTQQGLIALDALEDIDYHALRASAWEDRLAERGLA